MIIGPNKFLLLLSLAALLGACAGPSADDVIIRDFESLREQRETNPQIKSHDFWEDPFFIEEFNDCIGFHPTPFQPLARQDIKPGAKLAVVVKLSGVSGKMPDVAKFGLKTEDYVRIDADISENEPIFKDVHFFDEFAMKNIRLKKISFDNLSFLEAVAVFNKALRKEMPWRKKPIAYIELERTASLEKASPVNMELRNASPLDVGLALEERGGPLILTREPDTDFCFTDIRCVCCPDLKRYHCNPLAFKKAFGHTPSQKEFKLFYAEDGSSLKIQKVLRDKNGDIVNEKWAAHPNTGVFFDPLHNSLGMTSSSYKMIDDVERKFGVFLAGTPPWPEEGEKKEGSPEQNIEMNAKDNPWSKAILNFEEEEVKLTDIVKRLESDARKASDNPALKITLEAEGENIQQRTVTICVEGIPALEAIRYICRETDMSYRLNGNEVAMRPRNIPWTPLVKHSARLSQEALDGIKRLGLEEDVLRDWVARELPLQYKGSYLQFDLKTGLFEANVPEDGNSKLDMAVDALDGDFRFPIVLIEKAHMETCLKDVKPGSDATLFCVVKGVEGMKRRDEGRAGMDNVFVVEKAIPVSCRADAGAALSGWFDWRKAGQEAVKMEPGSWKKKN